MRTENKTTIQSKWFPENAVVCEQLSVAGHTENFIWNAESWKTQRLFDACTVAVFHIKRKEANHARNN